MIIDGNPRYEKTTDKNEEVPIMTLGEYAAKYASVGSFLEILRNYMLESNRNGNGLDCLPLDNDECMQTIIATYKLYKQIRHNIRLKFET